MFGAGLEVTEFTDPRTLRVGTLELDRARHRLSLNGREVALSRSEFLLLAALMERPTEMLSRLSLAIAIWGEHLARSGRPVDQHLYRLRVKLARAAAEAGVPPPVIEAVPNFGYRLVSAPAAESATARDA
jgi:DNA-binding response OmpR family regulator